MEEESCIHGGLKECDGPWVRQQGGKPARRQRHHAFMETYGLIQPASPHWSRFYVYSRSQLCRLGGCVPNTWRQNGTCTCTTCFLTVWGVRGKARQLLARDKGFISQRDSSLPHTGRTRQFLQQVALLVQAVEVRVHIVWASECHQGAFVQVGVQFGNWNNKVQQVGVDRDFAAAHRKQAPASCSSAATTCEVHRKLFRSSIASRPSHDPGGLRHPRNQPCNPHACRLCCSLQVQVRETREVHGRL
jgi:hypothetical protein